MRAPRVAVAAAVASSFALAACGSSSPVSTWSAATILARVAATVARAPALGVEVATPTTTLVQLEDARGDVSGHEQSANGEFWAIRLVAGSALDLSFNPRYVEVSAPARARADGAALRVVAAALASRWFGLAASLVDPSAAHLARVAFTSSPRLDESGVFGTVGATAVTTGAVTTFNHERVVPLTVTGGSEVLFVRDQSPPRAVGASVPLGGNTSPVLFTFSYPGATTITAPSTTSACALWRALPSDHDELTALGAPGAYGHCG